MHLKHLTLQGYKSFADKTEFEFPEGITIIVGPNGTGKSNIADGIRWALGERSMSTLRAKTSADMIFAGGDGRARAGMAEVCLTFDNTDGGLPIEFSEVTISRRAYRSGENEYLINGSQVLLRDVEELLAGSSLSERTYTVIGQGLVDAALSLRPQERRALFEEAAGITLYRDRREKTVERLDETERNLERVHDIISEVAPRLDRLEVDAHQVEQHRRLTAHLERLQRTWYGYCWGQRQAELGRALERASGLEEKLTARREDAAQLGERLEQVRQRESELRASLRDWYRRSADLYEHVDQVRRELAVSEERERLLKARREELLDEVEPLTAQREQQAEQVSGLDCRVEELADQLAERRRRLTEIEEEARSKEEAAAARERERAQVDQELRGSRSRLERLDEELAEAREVISRLVSEHAVAEERARQLESRREAVLAEVQPLRKDEQEQSRRVAESRSRVEDLEQALGERKQELADLEAAWRSPRERAEEPGQERVRVADKVRDQRAEIEHLDRALRRTREEEAALAGELRAVERTRATSAAGGMGVQALQDADLEGVLGTLAALIRVPSKWERAIEAVLGRDLQALLLETGAVVERAHEVLKAEGSRVTVIALDEICPAASSHRMPTGARCAADKVSCEDPVRPAVDALLGTVALCEDLSEARGLRRKMPAGSSCVTRAGIVVRGDGTFVIGGTSGGGILADERRSRELSGRLASTRRRLEELEERRQVALVQLSSLEDRLDEIDRRAAERRYGLQEKLGEARTAAAVAEEALRGQRAELEREKAELERIRSHRKSLQQKASALKAEEVSEIERAQALRVAVSGVESKEETSPVEAAEAFRLRFRAAQRRCQQVAEDRRAVSEKVSLLEGRLQRLSERAAEAREEMARFDREVLSEARTAVAVAETALDSRRQALERESALLERLCSQIDARRARAKELDGERQALLERIEGLRGEVSQLEQKLQDVRNRIQPAEDELEELNSRQTSLEKRHQRAQDLVRGAEERYGRAELDVERKRDELQLLADRIDEDLGLVELELGKSVTAQAPLPMRPLVSELPVVEQLPDGLQAEMQFVKKRLGRLGGINPNAPEELAEVRERHRFLSEQAADLEAATTKLRRSVAELDGLMERAFRRTFDAVAEQFSTMFSDLFKGGEARVALTDPDDLLNTGVDIVARPPGKRAQRLALLSGGERALTATALLFSLLQVSPTPFCVLDEVDAMLDEANVGRFRSKLEELAERTQFIVITHNRNTVESAETVYGVSMGSNAVSQVVSLKMAEAERVR